MDSWSSGRAARLAGEHLRGLSQRWTHVQRVAAAGAALGTSARLGDALSSACWLHDIGYAPRLERTGMHALDGALYLRELGAPSFLVGLVGYHTGAEYEAEERGLSDELAAIARPDQELLDALILADLTVGPTGETVSVDDRISEILRRYEPASEVHRAVSRSQDYLRECAKRAAEATGSPQEWGFAVT